MKKEVFIRKFVKMLLIIAIAAALPFIAIYFYALTVPHSYQESYYGALPIKYDRIKSIKEPKVVVIGGSSVAFGIDSKLVEKELGMPCVNFGLYAAFGLKPMLDLAKDHIRKGDIVIIAPELSSQMYSDYVGYEYLLEAMEGRTGMGLKLGKDYSLGLIKNLPSYAKNSKKLKKEGGLKVEGVYARSSFDEYGDIVYERPSSIMSDGYAMDNLPEIDEALITDTFADMINDFAKDAKKSGASVYFGFCPINDMSAKDITGKQIEAFTDKLNEKLDIDIIASLEDHIFDARYFYDSNFHTNEAGTTYNTILLINDINRVKGKMVKLSVAFPKPPANAGMATVISSGDDGTFTYHITTNGVTITGLVDSKKSGELVVPDAIENVNVVKIGMNAFKDSKASKVTIPSSVNSLSAALFENSSITSVYLNSVTLPEVGNSLLKDCAGGIKIYVPVDLYGNYVTDYFWGIYSDNIEQAQ